MQSYESPLKAMRLEAGLSLREVARRADINPGRLSTIERGLVPTKAEKDRIRQVLLIALAQQQAKAMEEGEA
jgi:transcriptional regulator with XRE-family HTH domain